MNWSALLAVIEAEVGTAAAARIEGRIRADMPGEVVALPGRRRPTKAAWSPPPPKARPPRVIR